MDKVKFGVIGVGNMGSAHAKRFLKGEVENAVLTAVCDLKQARLEAIRSLNGGESVELFHDYTQMLKSGLVDAVIVATPHYFHPEMVIAALEAGLHVICEKPAGVYTKQVKEMNAAAEKSDKLFTMMFNQRTNCVYRKIREMVTSGELGELRRINWIVTDWYRSQSYYDSGDWRATWKGEGGGVLMNQCPHQLDLLQWVTDMMPSRIHAFCHFGKWHDIEVEDDVTAYLEYDNGATGVFVTTTGDAHGDNRFEVQMDKARIIVEDDKLSLLEFEVSEPEWSKTTTQTFATLPAKEVEVETDGENPQHVGVLNAWAGAILRGEPLVAGGEEGINGLTLSNAMHLSAFLGQKVEIPFDEELYYQELMKRVATSRRKTGGKVVFTDTSNSYNGSKA